MHRETFRKGAAEKGIDEKKADEVFDLMEKFAGYGFNKSHAAAYALLSYHTAWLKAHYTAEFYAANMTIEMDDTDKLKVLLNDAKLFGIEFQPPCVNRGVYRFEPLSNRLVNYGLGAIKGTGRGAIEAILAAREAGGPFLSFYDFCLRVDRKSVNKRVVEALVKAGAFDSLNPERSKLLASVARGYTHADTTEANADQGGLFDFGDSHASSTAEPELVHAEPWSIKERLALEKTAIGFYLSGHLFDQSAAEVRRIVKREIAGLADSRDPVLVAGIVSGLRVINGQRGRVAIFKLDDKSEAIEAVANEELLNANKELLAEDELVIAQGTVRNDRFSGGLRLTVQAVWSLPAARARFGRHLLLRDAGAAGLLKELAERFPPRVVETEEGQARPQGLAVRVAMKAEPTPEQVGARWLVELGEASRFWPADEALARLGHAAEVIYEA